MDKFLEFVAEYVFSFGMFMFLFCVGAIILMGSIVVATDEAQEQTQLRTEACYAQGMVLIRSDAGERCVDPKSLVKVK
jgi:ABC-type iron transport system FetAB permease component